jgi:hypothetical protein
MQSFENFPTSATKRLGVSLNVDTGYKGKGKGRDVSPPLTPAAQTSRPGRGNIPGQNWALKVRTVPRETFLDDITPVDPSSNRGIDKDKGLVNRDSHDLSLSPRQVTRDSLVDNMLLSLDQFSFDSEQMRQPTVEEERLHSSFADEEPYQPAQNFVASKGGRGVGHSYSYSSDYENADDSSRYSGQLSRGRRSNSSSNFQSGLGRINSTRKDSVPSSTFNTRPPVQIPPRGIHSRSGKGSKGSSANSFDLGYAQVTSNQRWAHGLAGRSSSFDYGDRQSIHSNAMSRQINTSASNFSPYDYDAAPTPTVPGGPRRPRPVSPTTIPPQSPVKAEAPQKLERKRSTRSSKSAYKGKGSGNMSGGRFDYGLNDPARELPPMPAFLKEQPAPAPLVGYGKVKDHPGTSHSSKDRPGFFRRVFGSSRNHLVTSPDPPASHGSTTSAETAERPISKPHHVASQIKTSYATPPPREPPAAAKDHTHVLAKKPSSFFRRRKKSTSETEASVPLPIVPIRYQPELDDPKNMQLPSPVSSLRKVMNPYLKSPGRSPLDPQVQQAFEDQKTGSPIDDGNIRGFSHDYERDPIATIRTVKPGSRGTRDAWQSSPYPSKKSPISRTQAQLGLEGQSRDEGETFLQDSSDNDPDAHSTSSKIVTITKETPTARLGTLPPPSPSVARDMALVAEYERVHSKRSPKPAKLDVSRASPAADSPRLIPVSKSSPTQKISGIKDDDWVMLTPANPQGELEKDKESRVWLEPSSSEEDLAASSLALPTQGTEISGRNSGSTDTVYKSATSLPILQIEDEDTEPRTFTPSDPPEEDTTVDQTVPVEGDRERAKRIFDGNEDFIQKEKAAAWMGEDGPIRTRTLLAYMDLYDFANLNILVALRMMCGRLVLKAESQQVDRILDAFARRWCQSNPHHGFKVTGR